MSDDVYSLARSSIHARRHPAAILGMWAIQALFAAVATLPAVSLVRAAFGRFPSSDAALWEPGGLPLLAMLAREPGGVRAATATATAVVAIAFVGGLIPLAGIMAALANTGPNGRRIGAAAAMARAVGAFRAFGLLLLAMTLAEGIVAAIAVLAAQLVPAWTNARLGEVGGQTLGIAVGAAFLPLLALLGVLHDLARAVVVRLEAPPLDALLAALALMRDDLWSLAWSWSWRALAALAPLLAVAAVADRLGGRGGVVLVTLGVLHQLVAIVRVALRTSWLAKALRSVDVLDLPPSFDDRDDEPDPIEAFERGRTGSSGERFFQARSWAARPRAARNRPAQTQASER
jgi:hypothetical protein